ncbi:MAG: Nif3-like dinuclear metal center hexameric protein [Lachnospiraceae bacterium]|nr:Nif3-like dinuclear metal center hexameric protein [Lachnospiraceae bacterium]MBR1877065.1 Nif3-like dinuclear metal center hexameric protein [Lachnospiraceae bacterium]
MKLKDITGTLNELAPIQYSENWDNPGLLIGDEEKDIKKVYITLDATSDVIEAAHDMGADLILTHHPLIFHPVRRVSSDDHVGKRIMRIISYGMSLFTMHTDFDVTCMGTEAASMLDLIEIKILEPAFGEEIGLGAMGYLKEDLTLGELAEKTKQSFDVDQVTVYGDLNDTIVKVAVLPGSGSSGINAACIEGCDVLITGDIGHHDGTDALEKGINIIDAGHYGIEKLFIGYMKLYLNKTLPELTIIGDKAQKTYTIV